MPRRDGTGPIGQGKKTGKGKGFCCSENNTERNYFGNGNNRNLPKR
jgi:hypothetical protein